MRAPVRRSVSFAVTSGGVLLVVACLLGAWQAPPTVHAEPCQTSVSAASSLDVINVCSSAAFPDGIAAAINALTSDTYAIAFHIGEATGNVDINGQTFALGSNLVATDAFAISALNLTVINTGVTPLYLFPEATELTGEVDALAENTIAESAFAAAYNHLTVTDVVAPNVFTEFMAAAALNAQCSECFAATYSTMDIDTVQTGDAVFAGEISIVAQNQNSSSSAAFAFSDVRIKDSSALTSLVAPTGARALDVVAANGSFGDCSGCLSAVYNNLVIDGVHADGGSLLERIEVVATNGRSADSAAFAAQDVTFRDIVTSYPQAMLSTVVTISVNDLSANSLVVANQYIEIAPAAGATGPLLVGGIAGGNLAADVSSIACDNCFATATQTIVVRPDAMDVSGFIFGGYSNAIVYHNGTSGVHADGATAKAFNTVSMSGTILAGRLPWTVGPSNADADVFASELYAAAANRSTCIDCTAFAFNTSTLEDVASGLDSFRAPVRVWGENYDSSSALVIVDNRLTVSNVVAAEHIITDAGAGSGPGGATAFGVNSYCELCIAKAYNSLSFRNSSSTTGSIFDGAAYAWAENEQSIVDSDTPVSGDPQLIAVAVNNFVIDGSDRAETLVRGNVFSCANNNMAGNACPSSQVQTSAVPQAYCNGCIATAVNDVLVTNDGAIDIGGLVQQTQDGVYAHAENTALLGDCNGCVAGAQNSVLVDNATLIDSTFAMVVNTSSDNVEGSASNTVSLESESTGGGSATATNTNSTDSSATAISVASAEGSSTVDAAVVAANTDATSGTSLALGLTNASDGGTATNDVLAATGSTGSEPAGGVAVAIGVSNGNATVAESSSTADLSNDGTANGFAVSVSFDTNGNVALAVVAANEDAGFALSFTNAIDGTSAADAQGDGSGGETSGDLTFSTGTPEAHTETGAAP